MCAPEGERASARAHVHGAVWCSHGLVHALSATGALDDSFSLLTTLQELHCGHLSATDIKELRGLLDSWRDTKKSIWKTLVQLGTVAVLTFIATAVWMQVGK